MYSAQIGPQKGVLDTMFISITILKKIYYETNY